MYLFTIFAFACLFWRLEGPALWLLVADHNVFGTLAIVISHLALVALAAVIAGRRATRLLASSPFDQSRGHYFHHRATFVLRILLLAGFAGSVLLTPWPTFFRFDRISSWLQFVGDFLTISPYLTGCLILWVSAFPVERKLRESSERWLAEFSGSRSLSDSESLHADGLLPPMASGRPTRPWGLLSYLNFNLRHQFLVVAVPMMMILYAADLTHAHEETIRRLTGFIWMPDVVLGAAAAVIFLVSPLMLVHIWQTKSLDAGPLRATLQSLCERVGLRCRDILIWQSDGLMINAAVMGVVPRVRFVLLSDALLATMNERQVEAVFGHEAGHVRHKHIPHFLLFAFVGWIAVAGVMELLARAAAAEGAGSKAAALLVQGAGILAMLVFWGLGFGWVSRRFERQADLFGARCVTATHAECKIPCSVHLGEGEACAEVDRVCTSGATVFASALQRVAMLNGIPPEERSWRHSSIANRVRFLLSAANDPTRALGFERTVRRLKRGLLVAAIVGAAGTALYWSLVPEPAVLRLQASLP